MISLISNSRIFSGQKLDYIYTPMTIPTRGLKYYTNRMTWGNPLHLLYTNITAAKFYNHSKSLWSAYWILHYVWQQRVSLSDLKAITPPRLKQCWEKGSVAWVLSGSESTCLLAMKPVRISIFLKKNCGGGSLYEKLFQDYFWQALLIRSTWGLLWDINWSFIYFSA